MRIRLNGSRKALSCAVATRRCRVGPRSSNPVSRGAGRQVDWSPASVNWADAVRMETYPKEKHFVGAILAPRRRHGMGRPSYDRWARVVVFRLSQTIMASNGFIEPRARRRGSAMGSGPFVPLAVLMAAISTASEKASKPAEASKPAKAQGPSRPEPRELVAFLQMNPEEKFDIELHPHDPTTAERQIALPRGGPHLAPRNPASPSLDCIRSRGNGILPAATRRENEVNHG